MPNGATQIHRQQKLANISRWFQTVGSRGGARNSGTQEKVPLYRTMFGWRARVSRCLLPNQTGAQ